MSTDSTILQLLSAGSAASMAIAAPSVRPLTYGELRDQVKRTVETLNGFGVGRNDRVAIVLPNGPEMATAFVGIAAGASAAPLNPVYRIEEFEFYLSDLGAKALVLEQGSQSPARQVALRLGILVLELKTDSDPGQGAGAFTLYPVSAAPETTASGGFAQADDVALLLHTSGTTSRPKLVPLTQRNVVASARSIRATLGLVAEDRGLNIMPLFHIHGLMAGLLAPLAAGSQVFCTPGFNALKFFGWMNEARPTWYMAVPTMHQTILARASHHREVIGANPLRFVRSSSSSMPPQVIAELEATFHAPLIESYGMTEAAHQMASNPLPPGKRIPGTVGLAAGPEVAIMDD
ncbi:MAG: AMP-binding protein, partial [Planctomycetaceae bacterium]|nr:AMP-binding protein [Planctomycetaceae bacterium]